MRFHEKFMKHYSYPASSDKIEENSKDVHIVVPFAYLLSSYSKFEWAENAAVQART